MSMFDNFGFGSVSSSTSEQGQAALRRKQNLSLQTMDRSTQEETDESSASSSTQDELLAEEIHKATTNAAPAYASSYARFFKPSTSTIVKALPAGRRGKNKKE